MTLQHAFKEWAVVCAALSQGTQGIILRKGGIDEEFKIEQTRFWLYPTFTHQQREGIKDDFAPLLDEVEANRPTPGVVRLNRWAEVTGVYRVRELMPLLMIGHLHIWSDATVEQRFAYRTPGLNVLSVRVYGAPQTHEIAELPAYQGCKSWVALAEPLSTEGSLPILGDAAYRDLQETLDLLLSPTALA